jgi:hypothetical protein
MPKPTRRERRQLAEKGKLPARRPAAYVPVQPAATDTSAPRPAAGSRRVTPSTVAEAAAMPDTQDYAYVKNDLKRIGILASLLIAAMVGLRFVLPL